MSGAIPVNEWVSIPGHWKINHVGWEVCRSFIFYNIRPVQFSVELTDTTLGMKNGTRIIKPRQSSLIVGYEGGLFKCITSTSVHYDNTRNRLFSEYQGMVERGQAAMLYLDAGNVFNGPWEVFNGPNPVNLLS